MKLLLQKETSFASGEHNRFLTGPPVKQERRPYRSACPRGFGGNSCWD